MQNEDKKQEILNDEQQQKLSEIRALAEVMREYQLSEIEYANESTSIRLAMGGGAQTVVAPVQTTPVQTAPVATPVVADPVSSSSNNILSPMVGIVYLSKDPQSPAFVKVGDTVSVGQTICLIEAMKTFNPIKATKSGKITAILVENASPVEYDQPLFSVE